MHIGVQAWQGAGREVSFCRVFRSGCRVQIKLKEVKIMEIEIWMLYTAITIVGVLTLEAILSLVELWRAARARKTTEEAHEESVSWQEPCGICKSSGLPGNTWGARTLSPDTYERLTQPFLKSDGKGWIITPSQALWRRSGRGKQYNQCAACGRMNRVLKKRAKRRGRNQ